MTSWSMECRRAKSREDLVRALESRDRTTWVIIVDLDNVGVTGIDDTIDVLRAILPARIITIGKDSLLRKPLRQSHLFDAIAKAVGDESTNRAPLAPAHPVTIFRAP